MHSTDPAAVLLQALHARDEWRHDDLVHLADPASVQEQFDVYCKAVRPQTIDDLRSQAPELSSAELDAAYERWQAVVDDRQSSIARSVSGVQTYAELIVLHPSEFFARWMVANDQRKEIVNQLRKRDRPVPQWLLATPEGLKYTVIGSVMEAPDLVHVLYRIVTQPGGTAESRGPVEFETLRSQSDGSWRIIVSGSRFLQTRGNTISIIPEEFADLWDEDAP